MATQIDYRIQARLKLFDMLDVGILDLMGSMDLIEFSYKTSYDFETEPLLGLIRTKIKFNKHLIHRI